MSTDLVARLRRVATWTTPLMLTLVLVFVGMVPLGVPHFGPIAPAFALIAVYYWSIYRPEHLPAGAVFLIGLVQGALNGEPFGLTAVVLLIVYGVGVSQRRVFMGKSVLVEWWGFLLVGSGAIAVSWILACLYFEIFIDPRPAMIQALISVGAYPCVAWLFVRAQRRLMKPA